MEIANLSLVRKINYRVIWNALVKSKENTIIGLKKITGLSFPTINRAIEYGKEIGVIIDGEIEESQVGRKAQIYKVNNDFYHSIVIIADDDKISYKVYDIIGNELSNGYVIGGYIDLLANVEGILAEVIANDPLVSVMSMAVIGVVNQGIMIDCNANLALCNFDLKGYFERKFNLLVEISNNIKTVASSLLYQLKDKNLSTFAVFDYGYSGYGASFVANGEVMYGKNGFSGEVCYLAGMQSLESNPSIYENIIIPIVTVIAPKQIYLYTTFGEEFIAKFTDFIRKAIPSYAMPSIIVRDNIEKDMMSGLFNIINDSKLSSLL